EREGGLQGAVVRLVVVAGEVGGGGVAGEVQLLVAGGRPAGRLQPGGGGDQVRPPPLVARGGPQVLHRHPGAGEGAGDLELGVGVQVLQPALDGEVAQRRRPRRVLAERGHRVRDVALGGDVQEGAVGRAGGVLRRERLLDGQPAAVHLVRGGGQHQRPTVVV